MIAKDFKKLIKKLDATRIRYMYLNADLNLTWEQYEKIKELWEIENNEKRNKKTK